MYCTAGQGRNEARLWRLQSTSAEQRSQQTNCMLSCVCSTAAARPDLGCGSVPGRAHQQPDGCHKHAQHDGQQDVGALAGPAQQAAKPPTYSLLLLCQHPSLQTYEEQPTRHARSAGRETWPQNRR
jgi:hypothetical protein